MHEARDAYAKAYPHEAGSDIVLLEGVGEDILRCARSIVTISALVEGQSKRPAARDIAIRLVEAIDDQIDDDAWVVINEYVKERFS